MNPSDSASSRAWWCRGSRRRDRTSPPYPLSCQARGRATPLPSPGEGWRIDMAIRKAQAGMSPSSASACPSSARFPTRRAVTCLSEAFRKLRGAGRQGLRPNCRSKHCTWATTPATCSRARATWPPSWPMRSGCVRSSRCAWRTACASGGVALRQGVMAVASGMHDVVLVAGVERMTKLPTAQVTDTLGSAADTLYEILPAHFPRLLCGHRDGVHAQIRHEARAPDECSDQEPSERRTESQGAVRCYHP